MAAHIGHGKRRLVAMLVLAVAMTTVAAHAEDTYTPLLSVDLADNQWFTTELDLGGADTSILELVVARSSMDCPVLLGYELWRGPADAPKFLVGVSHAYSHGDPGATVHIDGQEYADVSGHIGCPNSGFLRVRLSPPPENAQGGPFLLVLYRLGGPEDLRVEVGHRSTENVTVTGEATGTGVYHVAADQFDRGPDSTYVGVTTDAPVQGGTWETMRNVSYTLTFANPPRLAASGGNPECSVSLSGADGEISRGRFASIWRDQPPGTYRVDVHSCQNFPPPPSGTSYYGRFKLTGADYAFPA